LTRGAALPVSARRSKPTARWARAHWGPSSRARTCAAMSWFRTSPCPPPPPPLPDKVRHLLSWPKQDTLLPGAYPTHPWLLTELTISPRGDRSPFGGSSVSRGTHLLSLRFLAGQEVEWPMQPAPAVSTATRVPGAATVLGRTWISGCRGL